MTLRWGKIIQRNLRNEDPKNTAQGDSTRLTGWPGWPVLIDERVIALEPGGVPTNQQDEKSNKT